MVKVYGIPVQRTCRAVGLGQATYYRRLMDWARRIAPVIAAFTPLAVAGASGNVIRDFGSMGIPIITSDSRGRTANFG